MTDSAQTPHASDCAVHNMPAYPNGPCDCKTPIVDAECYTPEYTTDEVISAELGRTLEKRIAALEAELAEARKLPIITTYCDCMKGNGKTIFCARKDYSEPVLCQLRKDGALSNALTRIAALEADNAELREKLNAKERDRHYHMDAINRLASFLALSGTSFEVIQAAIDNITRLTKERVTLEADLAEAKKWRGVMTDIADKAQERALAAEQRAEALAKDAARYRWLRDSKNDYPLFFIAQRDPNNIVIQFRGELADMNIDAAIAAQQGNGEAGK